MGDNNDNGSQTDDPVATVAGEEAVTQMSRNLQHIQLQSQLQHENRSYTAVSNIMKTKRDANRNSISNIR